MRTVIIALALSATISATDAQAGDIIGNGSFSCGNWTSNHQETDAMSLTDDAWLAGYLTAYSLYTDDEMHLPDQGARNNWVSNYCRNHPLDLITMAAHQLILELIKRQSSQR